MHHQRKQSCPYHLGMSAQERLNRAVPILLPVHMFFPSHRTAFVSLTVGTFDC